MAYDAAKAHEYYEKYRKKGLKKGRKKGTKAKKGTGTKQSLVGLSSSGLNDEGRVEAGIIKDRYKKAMNEALSKAKTPEEKERIRAEYSKKAQAEINALKNDSKYAKSKETKAKASSGASKAKASSGKASSGKKSAEKSSASSASSNKSSASAKVDKKTIDTLKKQMETLRGLMATASDEQKKKLVKAMTNLLTTLKSMKGVTEKEEKQYKADISGQSKSTNR